MPGSAATGEARLHIVEDHQGRQMTVGDVQAAWLVDEGYAERTNYQRTGPANAIVSYKALDGRTVDTLNEMVMAEPGNRECDFCRAIPSEWIVNVRPFKIEKGPTPAPFTRPVFVCDECEPLVRANDKPALMERMFESTVQRAMTLGGEAAAHVASLGPEQVRKGLAPVVREFVGLVFANRQGYPQKSERPSDDQGAG